MANIVSVQEPAAPQRPARMRLIGFIRTSVQGRKISVQPQGAPLRRRRWFGKLGSGAWRVTL